MKNKKYYLLLILFAWMGLFNTAFVLNSTVNTSSDVSIKTVEKTPQYKAPKWSFSEKLALKVGIRKLQKRLKDTLDFDKMAKGSRLFSGLSVVSGLSALSFIASSSFPILFLIALVLTLIFALIAAGKANLVTDNPLSTAAQKKRATRSRGVGCVGFVLLLFCIVAIVFSSSASFFKIL